MCATPQIETVQKRNLCMEQIQTNANDSEAKDPIEASSADFASMRFADGTLGIPFPQRSGPLI